MRNLIISLLFLSVIVSGCSGKDSVQFCEGVDTEGKGVNCGKKFTTGDLTGVIKNKEAFGTDEVSLKIARIQNKMQIPEKSESLKVDRDRESASAPLRFYNSGMYKVEVYKENDRIAEGTVEIVDSL